ncbi:bifunctional 4-hydroxy-2-oxoglutarate aldolase/2-dehydro-3-deoxy-phosphogluconate aldolase [Ferdinandcohnia sp. SAFN-114]|uniref:bifunctional 4-hydroxy-2-oxoglutarate aldolase/2-dehydro-3-deoxy-phosphogluconate aldolase n=1 Tax=Ferdinandcohnia sp. SAFN-114 TaxID=3387275 RepID=UPI003F7DFC51
MDFYEAVKQHKIIAIVRGVNKEDILPLTESLYNGGIRLIEVTMNTTDASEMISMVKREFGNKILVGAGTVVDLESAEKAYEAGAAYFITPNTDREVIDYALQKGVGILPGVMTPSEIVQAYNAGAKMVKVFPTSSLGSTYIKELQGPLSHIPMVAVGGVTVDTVADYINAGAVGFGIGGSLIDKEAIRKGDFDSITQKAAMFFEKCKGVEV